MEIREITAGDVEGMGEIDGTIESPEYLHLERSGEGLAVGWRAEPRPLRERLIDGNRLADEQLFSLRQVASGHDEGLALMAQHEGQVVAMLLAQPRPGLRTMRLVDVRIDYDFRRQGLGTALVYRAIHEARRRELRAVEARTLTNNVPAGRFLLKAGFDLAGLDTLRRSNHDLVKEAVTLFWYAALT